MQYQILTQEQQELLPYINKFSRTFYLAGGTAVALHIGHRRSVDFDLFTRSEISKSKINKKLADFPFEKVRLFEDVDQLHLIVNGKKSHF